MSKYSLDSLESIEEDSLEKSDLMNNNSDNDNNLEAIKSVDKFVKDTSLHLNPILTTLHGIKDNTTEPNGTVRGDRCAKINGGRNSITASGRRFVQRRQESSSTWNESRLRIRKGDDVVGKCEKEEGDANRRCCHTSTERCSPEVQNSSSKCNLRSSGSNAKVDKKLGNVFAPWSRPEPARPGWTSYSELYRRRFGIPRRPRIRSPEDSTLSICGDSQPRELSLDEGCSSLPGTSRDDSSELSFYRRFIEGHVTRTTHVTQSCEIPHRGILSNIFFPGEQCEHNNSDKLKKPVYRPYTIEEYRSLSMPRPDRSLGPDKDEVQIKREWLMRRRSYGDSVSARNREQILQQTRRLKSRRAIAQKCFLPPLKDRNAAASKDRENSRIPETDCAMQESLLKCPVRYPKEKEVITSEALPSQEVETLEETPNFSSSLASYNVLEDPYLETLQQRHLQEKKLADRLMRQALNS
ncbi:uncharacterized protein LOC115239172 [Formica exsecta]|uniref:uncharacterized protein LOC115239172 n=1 Tax=Formica exsecta TaxID=72781 RepID=UPI0011415E09|nr:uncharacterized protein LOC115239172 [Formica exsecta]